MRACFKKEYGRLVVLADEFHESDRTMQRNFLQYSLGMLRETLLHRSGATSINRVKGGELKFIQDFSKVMTPEKIERDLVKIVPQDRWILFSHQLIHHGRGLCKARKPECAPCKLNPLCYAPDKT